MFGAMNDNTRPFSSLMLDGPDRAPSRAMLYAVGFKKEDFSKPHIGIASTWSEVTPCNMHIDKLARESCKGADAAGGKGVFAGGARLRRVPCCRAAGLHSCGRPGRPCRAQWA